ARYLNSRHPPTHDRDRLMLGGGAKRVIKRASGGGVADAMRELARARDGRRLDAAADRIDQSIECKLRAVGLAEPDHPAVGVDHLGPALYELRLAAKQLLVRRLGHLLAGRDLVQAQPLQDRKSTRLNSSHANISYAVFCL